MDNVKPIVLQKNADKRRNRIIIPNFFIKKYGNVFYMNIFENKIELIPVNNKTNNTKTYKKENNQTDYKDSLLFVLLG